VGLPSSLSVTFSEVSPAGSQQQGLLSAGD
jgi:hypothetical protein